MSDDLPEQQSKEHQELEAVIAHREREFEKERDSVVSMFGGAFLGAALLAIFLPKNEEVGRAGIFFILIYVGLALWAGYHFSAKNENIRKNHALWREELFARHAAQRSESQRSLMRQKLLWLLTARDAGERRESAP